MTFIRALSKFKFKIILREKKKTERDSNPEPSSSIYFWSESTIDKQTVNVECHTTMIKFQQAQNRPVVNNHYRRIEDEKS